MSNLVLRTFEYGDLKQTLEIEKASFPDPYSELVFRWLKLKAGEGFVVAIRDQRVVGYAISEIREGQGHIASMAVSPDCRRAGIGELLARESLGRLAGKAKQVYLEVRPTNEAAICLYHKLLFRETDRIKKRYYPDGEDALVMMREI